MGLLAGIFTAGPSDLGTTGVGCSPFCPPLGAPSQLHTSTLEGATVASTLDTCASDGILTAITGYPEWRSGELGLIAKEQGDAAALAFAYQRQGSDFLEQLSGQFSCLVYSPKENTVLGATDRLGRQPLYYTQAESGLIFSTHPTALNPAMQTSPAINKQGVFNYVYFHMVPSPGSIFESVYKLPAAHYAISSGGKLATERYWRPNFHPKSIHRASQSGSDLKQALKDAVKQAWSGRENTAAFLSGGLDSSTVAGFLAELSENTAHAYSIGFSAEGYDEMAYARLTAEHFGLKLHEYYVTPEDIVSALPEVAASFDEPFGNSSALPAWFCAKKAASDGVNRLLAGDGGDELFAGNERYAKQQLFERFRGVSRVASSILGPLLQALPPTVPFVTKGNSFLQQVNTPLPDRLQAYNFLHRHRPDDIFKPELLSQISTSVPLELQRTIFSQGGDNASTLDKMLFFDWHFTLADNDLRKVSGMCEKAGVEVVYPMLDDELVRFSTQISDKAKLKGNRLRHYYKESLRGWLPDATIDKQKHGFGLPFGVWMRDHKNLQELAYESLSSLKHRDYFQSRFIDETIELHRSGHASYYGELVWILMVLELWLQGKGYT